MKYPKLSLTLGVGLLTAIPLTQLSAQPAPEGLVYEGFDYATDLETLVGADGGLGWDGAWGTRADVIDGSGSTASGETILDGSLSFTDGLGNELVTSGNHVLISGVNGSVELGRKLAAPFSDNGDSTYFSFLVQRTGPEADPTDTTTYPEGYPTEWGDNLYPRGANLRFWSDSERGNVGNNSNSATDTIKFTAKSTIIDSGVSYSDGVHFVVVRMDHDAENGDTLYLWVDPDLDAEDLTAADTAVAMDDTTPVTFEDVEFLSPFIGNEGGDRPYAELLMDEFRIGDSWEMVAQHGADFDGDGYSDAIDPDKDNDWFLDEAEVALGTSPFNVDTDGDGDWDVNDDDPLGTPLAYEGFDYSTDAELAALNEGTGFSNGWTASSGNAGDGIAIASGSQGYQDAGGRYLVTSGNSAVVSGSIDANAQFFRNVEDLDTLQDGSYYVSFILERQGETDEAVWGEDEAWTGDSDGNPYSRNVQFALLSQHANNSATQFGGENAVVGGGLAGSTGNHWMFQSKDITENFSDANYPDAGLEPFYGNEQFVVVRVDPGAGTDGTDYISVYFSPELNGEGDNTATWEGDASDGGPFDIDFGAVGMLAGSGSSLRAPGVGAFDEIRVGKTWTSVTPYDIDTDGDGTPDFADDDIDGDGLDNDEEEELGTNPYLADTDGDGVSDADELAAGTDPIGTVIAYEGFDYEAGTDLLADAADGGEGWSGSWTMNSSNGLTGHAVVQDGGLDYQDDSGNILITSGNHVYVDASVEGGKNAQLQRHLETVLESGAGSYYISFIGERQGEPDPNVEGTDEPPYAPNAYGRNSQLAILSSGFGEAAGIGNFSNVTTDTWKLWSGNGFLDAKGDGADSGVEFSNNQQFVVVRVDVETGKFGGHVLSMYLDPTLTGEAHNQPDVEGEATDDYEALDWAIGGIGLYVGNEGGGRSAAEMSFDEIRVGRTWQAVTPHARDTDGDGDFDFEDDDIDGDGLENEEEEALGTNPYLADTDGDGVNDADEVAAGTDPIGTTLAYEGFDYPVDTDLLGDSASGGEGWSGAWTMNSSNALVGHAVVQDGGLDYQDDRGNILITSGNHVYVDASVEGGKNAQFQRHLETVLDSGAGSYYISFIGERQGEPDPNVEGTDAPPYAPNEYARNSQLAILSSGFGEAAGIGNFSNVTTDTWKLWSGNGFLDAKGEGADSGVQFSYNKQFAVVRVDVEAGEHGGHVLSLYLDPHLSTENGNNPVVQGEATDDDEALDWAIGGIGLYVGNMGGGRSAAEMAFDEIRVGRTWQAVTPHDRDTDGDGTLDSNDEDIDGDGLTNEEEAELGTNPYLADTDGDGVSDADEVAAGTDPIGSTLAYEGFDYPAGTDLLGDSASGGEGWSGAWTMNSSNALVGQAVVQDGGLGYEDDRGNILMTSGNHVYIDATVEGNKNAQFQRHLETVLDSGAGTYYISFIGERQGEPDPNVEGTDAPPYAPNEYARNSQLAILSSGFGEAAGIGNFSNVTTDTWKLWSGNGFLDAKGEGADSGVQFSYNQQFAVVRVEVEAGDHGGHVLSLFLDPTLTGEEYNQPVVQGEATDDDDALDWAIGGIGLYVGNMGGGRSAAEMSFDEIRVGRTWQAVTPHDQDTDGDGVFDSVDNDIDGDGIPNYREAQYGTDPYRADTDFDGVSDSAEIRAGTDPIGTPIAYEGFAYDVGTDLLGDGASGGTGWSGQWTMNSSNGLVGHAVVQENSLTYEDAAGDSLMVSGNHVYVDASVEGGKNAQLQRHLASVLENGPGTYYVSFIGERQGEPDPNVEGTDEPPYAPNEYARNSQLALLSSGFGEAAGIGNFSNLTTDTWKMWSGNGFLDARGTGADSGVQFSNNQTFVVVRIDVEAGLNGGHVMSLYLDPELASENGNDPVVHGEATDDGDGLDWMLGGIGLYVGNQGGGRSAAEMAFDEIRVGATWLAVTPIDGDLDNDGIPDSQDDDIDGDGVPNDEDAFPRNPNESVDTDGDGIGNNADRDADGDGTSNELEIALGTDPLDADDFPSTQSLDLETTPGMYYNGGFSRLALDYSTNDLDNAPAELGFRIHYNSDLLALDFDPADAYADGTIVTDSEDAEDLDDSELTDRFMEVNMAGGDSLVGDSELPVEIGKVEVTAQASEAGSTTLRFTPMEQEEGFFFEAESRTIPLLRWHYDAAYGWMYPYSGDENLVYSYSLGTWLYIVDETGTGLDDAFAYNYASGSWLYLNFDYGGWYYSYRSGQWVHITPLQ